MNTWTVVSEGLCRWLKRGNECHGGINVTNPDVLSTPHLSFMLRNHPQSGAVLHIGLGAGEIPRFLSRYPNIEQAAVEIDPSVLDLAPNFNLPANLTIWEADANLWIKKCYPFDHVFLDTGVTHPSSFFKHLRRVVTKSLTVNLFSGDQHQTIERLHRNFKVHTTHNLGMNTVIQARPL